MEKINKKIILVIIILNMFSCRNKDEKKIINNWYNYEQSTKLTFRKEHLIIYDFQIQKTTWKVKNNQIIYPYKHIFSDSISKVVLNYKLKGNDTLLLKNLISHDYFVFLKAQNYLQYLFKINKINIDLEKNSKAFIQENGYIYGVKIFIGYVKNEIVAKSEYSNNLNNLNLDIQKKLEEVNYIYEDKYKNVFDYENWKNKVLHYSVFVDKKIPVDTLNFFLNKLNESSIKKIHQVYDSKDEELSHFLNLKEIKR